MNVPSDGWINFVIAPHIRRSRQLNEIVSHRKDKTHKMVNKRTTFDESSLQKKYGCVCVFGNVIVIVFGMWIGGGKERRVVIKLLRFWWKQLRFLAYIFDV